MISYHKYYFILAICVVFQNKLFKVSAPLSNCTKEEIHTIISFLNSEKVKPAEIIHSKIESYIRSNIERVVLSRSKLYKRIDHFKKERSLSLQSVFNEKWNCRLFTSKNESSG